MLTEGPPLSIDRPPIATEVSHSWGLLCPQRDSYTQKGSPTPIEPPISTKGPPSNTEWPPTAIKGHPLRTEGPPVPQNGVQNGVLLNPQMDLS